MAVKLLLSRLAYEAIKQAITMGGSDFSYDSYTRGTYFDNQDYEEKDNQVWAGINTALARLSDYEKLPLFQKEEQAEIVSGFYALALPEDTKEVKNIYCDTADGYVTFPFSITSDTIVIKGSVPKSGRLIVEYSKSFPHFSREDIVATLSIGEDDPLNPGTTITEYTDRNIDLAKDYHLTAEGFEYAKMRAESEIMRIADPSRANDLINVSENYFNDMATYRPTHRQRKVKSTFAIA